MNDCCSFYILYYSSWSGFGSTSNLLLLVCEHLEVCGVCRSEYSVEKNFRILDKGKNDFEITIKESLQIKKREGE